MCEIEGTLCVLFDSLCFDCIVLIVAIVLDDILSSQACTHRRFVLETKAVY